MLTVHKNQTEILFEGNAITALKRLPAASVDCIVTSPPYYGLRDYGQEGQIGLEPTFENYLDRILEITAELKRVLKPTGTLWWVHGDSYTGSGKGRGDKNPDPMYIGRSRSLPPTNTRNKAAGGLPRSNEGKCLLLQPYRLAARMIDEQGWILRNAIQWHKPNAMPDSVRDRFTVDHETILFFTKARRYFFKMQYEPLKSNAYDQDRMSQGKVYKHKTAGLRGFETLPKTQLGDPAKGRHKRTIWSIPTQAFKGAHFATYPEKLVEQAIDAGCPEGGVVLDPFMGSGTTGVVAGRMGRFFIGIELNEGYFRMSENRIKATKNLFSAELNRAKPHHEILT